MPLAYAIKHWLNQFRPKISLSTRAFTVVAEISSRAGFLHAQKLYSLEMEEFYYSFVFCDFTLLDDGKIVEVRFRAERKFSSLVELPFEGRKDVFLFAL